MEKDEDVNSASGDEYYKPETLEQPERNSPTDMGTEEVQNQRSRLSSIPADQIKEESAEETQLKTSHLLEDSFQCSESESARRKLISDALQQEDEFLEYLMSLPAASSGAKEKQKPQQKHQTQAQPHLMRSVSSYSGHVSSGGGAKVGLDHLDNLCKLMEQLGDLREQNSKLQRRVQYLEDLKNLQEMHKQLQEETKRREFQEVAFLHSLQQHRQSAARRHQHRRIVEESFPNPKREGSEDSLTNGQLAVSANNKRNSKCKSMTNGKFRQSLLRYQQRERSRSVGIEEIKRDKVTDERSGHETCEATKQKIKRQEGSLVGIAGGTKAKVSKWTKVKEAFRWEKASVVMLPEAKSQDSGIGGGEDTRYLKVPYGDNLLSVSPADSVLSGHSSSACSSGGQSPGYITCHHPLAGFTLPPATALSSSSSSEDLDIDLNLADILGDYGPQRSASATDSTGGRLLAQDTRRRSLTQMPEEEDASRRSKSLDGDATIGNSALIARHFTTKDGISTAGIGKLPHQKIHKTPWGKVKDIIQTRKDSLKKRHRHTKADTGSKSFSEAAVSDHEEEPIGPEQTRDSSDKEVEPTGTKFSSTKPRIEVSGDGVGSIIPTSKRQHSKTSTSSLDGHLQANDSPTNRRLTPVLTITLPSTEELRTEQQLVRSNSKPPPSPQTEERHAKISTVSAPANATPFKSQYGANGCCERGTAEDATSKCDQYKRQVPLSRPVSVSAAASPPVHRRASKWTKVKKAFLTSSTPGRISSSVPSSPNRNSSFFDEMDTDELSSGEYGEIGVTGSRSDDVGDAEGTVFHRDPTVQSTSIHAEIQRNYEELQQKLSQEFHKKLHGWEKMKSSSSGCRCPGGDDGFLHHDKGFRRKMEEWERMKNPQQNQSGSGTKHRDSVAFQTLDEDSLSPDFRKKLQEWQRIKKSLPAGTTPQSTGETYASGSSVPPQFKKKIAEWQLWRSGSGKGDSQHRVEDQVEDFSKKPQEWDRVKAASSSPSPETVTSALGQDSSERASGTKTPSPGIVRKDSTGNSKVGSKKMTGNSKSSGGVNSAEILGSGKDKYEGVGTASTRNSGAAVKVYQKGKCQKEKELQWLEKELQKIEREKQRLEREREKYLEREARLEKMRRAMGSGQRKQEVLIQTSTGFFRFQGISEKFTRRLYEWEKAKGIGPEASTFALLDPGYRPNGGSDNGDGGLLSRSKSASSVTNLGAGVTNVGTSSLSLNDVEALEQAEVATMGESRAASEPHLRTIDGPEDDEPAAVIVDVEDVIEETAAPLPVTPVVHSQTPVYCYAPEEVTRLIDSSGSDSERDSSQLVHRNDSVRTESSYKLLEENMSLLNKLKLKEDICRKLGNEIETLEEKIDDVAKTHKRELQRLIHEETDLHVHQSEGEQVAAKEVGGPQEELVAELRARIRELEQRQEWLLREGETLQDSFAHHSEQQAALAQNLVGKMKQLQEANINMASCDESEAIHLSPSTYIGQQVDAMNLVQDLTTQLLNLAEKLEVAIAQRSNEVHNLRLELQDRRHVRHKLRSGHHWFSGEGMSVSMGSLAEPEVGLEGEGTYAILPRQSSEELTQLPSLLTNKVLELKEGLNYLRAASGVSAPNQQISRYPAWEQEADGSEATATFVFKCYNKTDQNADTGQDTRCDSPAVEQIDSEGNTSPITCVTITPAFRKKKNGVLDGQTKDSTKEDEKWLNVDTKSTVNINTGDGSLGEEISTVNRENYCFAVSSASTTSSVCDDEEGEDVHANDVDAQKVQAVTAMSASEENANRKSGVSDESENESSDDEAKEDDYEEEDTKTIIKCESDVSIHKNSIYSGLDDNENHNYKGLLEDSFRGYYETEVYTAKGASSNAGRQRKILKTRRISDTHIGYKRDVDTKFIPQETFQFGCEDSNYNVENGKSVTNSTTETCQTVSASSAEISCQKDRKKDSANQEHESEHRECKSGVTDAYITENTFHGNRDVYSTGRDETLASAENGAYRTNYYSQNVAETFSTPTPDNVFVKTTRKIFSPVRRDSRGKASSVISYIVGETCGVDASQSLQDGERCVPVTSPVISVLRRQQSGNTSSEMNSVIDSKGKTGRNGSPPSWMFTRNRSQSSSPSLMRRSVDKCFSEVISISDQNSAVKSQNTLLDKNFQGELNVATTANRNCESDRNKEIEFKSKSEQYNFTNKDCEDEIIKPEKQTNIKSEADSRREILAEKNKTDKCDNSVASSRSAITSSGFPPLPQSPIPGRRDHYRLTTKETAPSIRMMIAKYNQKLTEQQEGAGGRSPEVSGSGSASPVAWRSPVAERRVRAQMEKYQEEVQRVLQKGGRKIAARLGGNKVQKSASDGIIRSQETPLILKSEAEPNKDSVTSKANSLPNSRPILKSTSAGSIKAMSLLPVNVSENKTAENVETVRAAAKPPAPRVNISPSPSSPSSPELGLHHSSPPPSRLRALRLQRAKEEFLTRGPGGRSWTSDGGTPSTDTLSASVSPEPFWEQEASGGNLKDVIRPGLRMRKTDSEIRSRLSQISVESESSYDGSVVLAGGSGMDSGTVSDEGMILVKSASAGMINVDPNTYRKFHEERGTVDQYPNTSDSQDVKTKSQACGRFGISSITSRFRKVKMRRSKGREGGKMNTVSMLCRQSLVVDLNLSKCGSTEVPGPSTSMSCPSSPVLQRPSSGDKSESDTSSGPTSWILNPARKIFKPK